MAKPNRPKGGVDEKAGGVTDAGVSIQKTLMATNNKPKNTNAVNSVCK